MITGIIDLNTLGNNRERRTSSSTKHSNNNSDNSQDSSDMIRSSRIVTRGDQNLRDSTTTIKLHNPMPILPQGLLRQEEVLLVDRRLGDQHLRFHQPKHIFNPH
jgi:hypothetical protein